ncbi:hypothetical protein LY76DRAFT_362082 [Colletotrichum caudatum]|nr:hypothetical protein LY76DRAFT_362082 [Colletotrichum caudatum]
MQMFVVYCYLPFPVATLIILLLFYIHHVYNIRVFPLEPEDEEEGNGTVFGVFGMRTKRMWFLFTLLVCLVSVSWTAAFSNGCWIMMMDASTSNRIALRTAESPWMCNLAERNIG